MFFQKKTVTSIIAGFDKMADDLDKVSAEMDAKQKELAIEISQKTAEQRLARDEAIWAQAVRENILKIVGG